MRVRYSLPRVPIRFPNRVSTRFPSGALSRALTCALACTLAGTPAILSPSPASAQTDPVDLISEFRELVTRQVAPAEQAERNAAVAAWLEQAGGVDLGEYGFLRSIARYFGQEYAEAGAGLAAWIEEHGGFPTDVYDIIIGRVFMNVLITAVREADWPAFDHALELALAFYDDPGMVLRAAGGACRRDGTLEALQRLETITTRIVHDERFDDPTRRTLLASIYPAPRRPAGFSPFRAADLDGRPISPEDYRGSVLLIDFWATWCAPCLAEMPNVVEVYRAYHAQGFEIIGVSLDRAEAEEQIRSVMREQGMVWRQVYDGGYWQAEVAVQNNIHSIPATFLLDRTGKVRYTNLRGAELERRVRELVAEPPPGL